MNDSRPFSSPARETVNNSPALTSNTTAADGGLGQYITGTFTGDATGIQVLTFSPANTSNPSYFLNGLQLRVLASVPKPTLGDLARIWGSDRPGSRHLTTETSHQVLIAACQFSMKRSD